MIKTIRYFFLKKEKFIKNYFNQNLKNYFGSYHFRPKKLIMIDDSIKIKNKLEKVGIVIQGPLKLEDNFTYETIKFYKEVYKNCEIILSTWDDENIEELQKIGKLGVEIIKNKRPIKSDINNLSYQVISTKAGIELAEKKQCSYILKTRTDFRIYDTGVDKFLISLLKTYPSNNKYQNERIIGIGLNIRKYDPSFSDLFQFGSVEEIKKMWDIELNISKTSAKIYEGISKVEFNNYFENDIFLEKYRKITYPEGFIFRNYLEKLGIALGENLENYYKILKDNFIIIDMSMINLYWNKYSKDEYKETLDYKRRITRERMKYKDWQTIYFFDVIEPNIEIYKKSMKELKGLTINDFEKY